MIKIYCKVIVLTILCTSLLAQEDLGIYKKEPTEDLNAATFLALEGFETAVPPTGWLNFSFEDIWEQSEDNPYNGNYNAVANYFGNPYADTWLITPLIDLSSATDPVLKYYEYVELYDLLEGEHNVMISTNYSGSGNPYAATWNTLRAIIQGYFSWELREINLSSYIGETVYIAFQYVGTNDDDEPGTVWHIDGVEVSDFCSGLEPIPNCAALNTPPDGAALLATFASFWWNPPAADVTKQFLYVGTDGGGITTPTNLYNGLEYTENTIGVGPVQLLANTTYYWQIIPANCSQTAVNCPIWSFTTNNGEVNYGGGGITQGGYYWANSTTGASTAPSQPTYSWVDISGTGTDLIGTITDNETKGPYPLGFTFNYFGVNYTEFYISANGFITFTATGGSNAFPYPIPASSSPNNLIAGFWKNLDPTNTNVADKHLYYGSSGGDMVITFENYPESGADADGWITFQIIIKQSGNIKIQYNNSGTSFNLNIGTVGIENSDGTKGILYRHRQYGGAVFSSTLAVEFGLNSSALPVELSSFTAEILNAGVVKLNWTTETEVDNYGFGVERALSSHTNLQPWKSIGFVEGHGNSNSPKHYSFLDKNLSAEKYSYRLKQIDTDGDFEYSNIIEVDFGLPDKFALNQNYPNPFNPNTNIQFAIPQSSFVTLEVFNTLGEMVEILVSEELNIGTYNYDWNASNLTSGIYFYKLHAGNFVEMKKMILIK